jgi:long-chain acyl-CoA synthetase
MSQGTLDVIPPDAAHTLSGLFRERVARSPDAEAYRYFDAASGQWRSYRWAEAGVRVARIQAALAREDLAPGSRVAIMLRNCPEWVFFEQAALGLGLVVVPLYTNDRAENVSYVLQDAGVQVLLVECGDALKALESIAPQLQGLARLVSVDECGPAVAQYPRLVSLAEWAVAGAEPLRTAEAGPDALATLVYTSGTTGRPKGVMLSHRNILFNARAAAKVFAVYREDLFLSFLPLSHMLERTVGYYIPLLCGATVAFARSVPDLPEDLLRQRPTILISVPRIYERVYNKIHAQLAEKSSFTQGLFRRAVDAGWRRFRGGSGGLAWPLLKLLVADKVLAKLGGNLRLAICGGAPLSAEVAKTFIGLGLNLIQGYGLTETSPIISGNPQDDNEPASVGVPLPGIEVKIGADDELLTRSPSVMLGYWHNPEATRAMIDSEGWLHTGDQVRMENHHIYITGRLKEIIVLSNGEKVPPVDMEMAIALDPLFEQVLVVGEGRPFLTALAVLNPEHWRQAAQGLGLDPADPAALETKAARALVVGRIGAQIKGFPGYAKIRAVALQLTPWGIDDETLTPTLKLRRNAILARDAERIARMYEGH